jgi:hypothetical protein
MRSGENSVDAVPVVEHYDLASVETKARLVNSNDNGFFYVVDFHAKQGARPPIRLEEPGLDGTPRPRHQGSWQPRFRNAG